jgi:two-component system chemotaxis sensor kinase CheA
MFAKLFDYLVLPGKPSEFEVRYLRRINRIALLFFASHIPFFAIVAFYNQTGPLLAIGLTSLVFAGPWLAYRSFENVRWVSIVYGFASMLMGGLLVHFGQGEVQIEMHFYFFALLAMLSAFGNPLAIVVAAVTVAAHHLTLWAYLPKSVFNYDAPIWVVWVHSAFVVLESVATCFIARSFFDNVIGLEQIVQARTLQLDARNRDMRRVLDNASQGFLTIDRGGRMSAERSAILASWFGPATEEQKLSEYIDAKAPGFAAELDLGWDAVIEDVMPLELTMYQLPKRFSVAAQHYHIDWTPILRGSVIEQALVMISDVTAEYERERLESEQRDVLKILGRVVHDKQGVLEFFDEARDLVNEITNANVKDLQTLRRAIHTLKGNSLLFGVQTIADVCHALEDQVDQLGDPPSSEERADLRARWDMLCKSVDALLGADRTRKLEIDDEEYEEILHAVLRGEAHAKVAVMISNWKLEPTRVRLQRVADQAQSIARRIGKAPIRVHVSDNALRLDADRWSSFWTAFVHVVRNAVDHGLETLEARSASGKHGAGTLDLSTRVEGDEFIVEIGDDGFGIDWKAVADKARASGLPHETQADLVEALFADGLTTRREVSEMSGRGVGMGAVRAACTARGGSMRVHSQLGAGTRVEFRFPRDAMHAPFQLQAAS